MPLINHNNEVKKARSARKPIVALESTIISHGMPWPKNLEMALELEETIRDAGAVPATVAVLDGKLKVGLTESELKILSKNNGILKLSSADLAASIIENKNGATTVSATMVAAYLSGISVFATGGVGGVHRGAEKSFDISCDLIELSKTPVMVVSAGVKSVLDIPKTLEVLETLGVPVISVGQDDFPGFWSTTSGCRSPLRLDDAKKIADCHKLRKKLGFSGGQLVANPIPEDSEIPLPKILPYIKIAIKEADEQKVSGKRVTPFLLKKIFTLTNGKSLEANIKLVLNNAKLAATIARYL